MIKSSTWKTTVRWETRNELMLKISAVNSDVDTAEAERVAEGVRVKVFNILEAHAGLEEAEVFAQENLTAWFEQGE